MAPVANGNKRMEQERQTHSPSKKEPEHLSKGRRRRQPGVRSALGIAPGRKIHRQLAKKGELVNLPNRAVLVQEGQYGNEIFVVKSGAVILSKTLKDGRRQVVGFRFPGDLITSCGSNQVWSVAVKAIAPSQVRRIRWEMLNRFLEDAPDLWRWLLNQAGDEIVAAQGQLLTVGRRNKEERLAAFVLEIWHRTRGRPAKPPEIGLAMHRAEIADYLGLTTETVSRVFAQFARERLIALPQPSRIKLLNTAGLEDLALGRRDQSRRSDKAQASIS